MKRYMKHRKIDFFESPHPRHFDFNDFRENKYHQSEDHDPEEKLFPQTPQRTPQISSSPHRALPDFFPYPLYRSQTPRREDSVLQNSQQMENQQMEYESPVEIYAKLEFSEQQDLLLPLTPQKNGNYDQAGDYATTARKKHCQNTPTSQGKFYQRGLKKLAHQAFKFVSNQKKTTYKQVAKKLINQLNDQNQMDIHKKGEMNIKRRVYDALNVLIALGLLKRNGNKILGKKMQTQSISFEKTFEKDKQRNKEENLQEELDMLRREFQSRQEIVKQKEKLCKSIEEKIKKVKELTQRNKMMDSANYSKQNRIQLPFVMLCQSKPASRSQQMVQEGNLQMWQPEPCYLNCAYNSNSSLDIMADLDVISHLRLSQFQCQQKVEKLSKRLKHK